MSLSHLMQTEKFFTRSEIYLMKNNYKVVVVGLGYVGLSSAVLLAQKSEVIGVDLSVEKVKLINQGVSPILDDDITNFLREENLSLTASTDLVHAVKTADYVIIATPTNYDETINFFDTSSVEEVIELVTHKAPEATVIIKSTIPIGFTDEMREKFQNTNIIFSPEFLREGRALHDNLYPSRIVVGDKGKRGRDFARLLRSCARVNNAEILLTDSYEAESIKLFANTYLALRVSFFNELDSFCLSKGLDTHSIIEGVSMDPRIGKHYNNPSFGYGGYCLPKDTKQIVANFEGIPQALMSSIVASNQIRKEFIVRQILKENIKVVGIYRLAMKAQSDNFRQSAIFDIMHELKKNMIEIIVYEPLINQSIYDGYRMVNDLVEFKNHAQMIIANRIEPSIADVKNKVFSRDVYNID